VRRGSCAYLIDENEENIQKNTDDSTQIRRFSPDFLGFCAFFSVFTPHFDP
jgi:hypothetical protein